MRRRAALKLAAGTAGSLAAGATATARAATEKKTYVLVHGTWHGGWMWKPMRDIMRAAGHDVYSPTCTGCGERSHLASPEIGLDTHITDIASVIECEELGDVILVGHSFAGLVITGVADRLRDRMRRLVFFDALVPTSERLSGVSRGPNGDWPEYWLKRKQKFIDGYMMDFFSEYPLEMLVPKTDEKNRAWLKRRITPHPARAWSDTLELKHGGWSGLPRTYIHCVGQEFSKTSDRMVGPANDDPEWDYRPVPYPRNAMLTHPQEMADLLMGLS